MMMSLDLVAVVVFFVFVSRRIVSYLHIFQQDEYDNARFIRWLFVSGSFDRKLSLGLLLIGAAALWRPLGHLSPAVSVGLAAAAFAVAAALEPDPRKVAKKKLVMTARAKRIFGLALVLMIAIGTAFIVILPPFAWVVPIHLVPFVLALANLILLPFEHFVQMRYWMEAHAKIASYHPTIIGITGSYGKTSVKHILGHILQMVASTLITPGSVNTAMGISRIVRENLGVHHRYFLVEMGAYGRGSIARLCTLAPPAFGVITAIGKAHYERYKSLDAVAETKFELAHAVQRNGGKVVTWADALSFPAGRAFAAGCPQSLITCGTDECSLTLRSVRATTDGVFADVVWAGKSYILKAPLYGLHNGENIAIAFAAACTLGVAPEQVQMALLSTPQITHRLEVKHNAAGAVVIDDAYNSNPRGFATALEVLGVFGKPGGRRILVTPGMVELGAAHEPEHQRIGSLAAKYVDLLLAVAPARITSFITAYTNAAPHGKVVFCATFAVAEEWLAVNLNFDDVVLLENDLPDLYERKLRM